MQVKLCKICDGNAEIEFHCDKCNEAVCGNCIVNSEGASLCVNCVEL